MSHALHATDYLAAPEKHAPRPVCAVFGEDAFLKRHVLARLREAVLGTGESDFSFTAFEGPKAKLSEVLDELSTVAMFGGKRFVLVDEADDFVTSFRGELQDYVARPRTSGVLVLSVKTWPSTTLLFKAVAATGLQIECNAPAAGKLPSWLISWARQAHNIQLASPAAEALIDLIGAEPGLLDQELAKLALTTPPGGKVTAEAVHQSTGNWRAKTVWQMLDAVLAGDVRGAVTQLDRLLLAGEEPIGILAQISASLRRLAAATRLILVAEAGGRRIALREALQQAGIKSFVLEKSERHLRRLGRERGNQLYDWLLQADLDMKGASALGSRLVLERLILRIAVSPPSQSAAVR